MDFRGHGQSGRPPAGSDDFDHLAEDLLSAVADAYGATVVAGGSMGAAATLRVLEENPTRFEKLIILLPARLEAGDETYVRLSRMADLLEAHAPSAPPRSCWPRKTPPARSTSSPPRRTTGAPRSWPCTPMAFRTRFAASTTTSRCGIPSGSGRSWPRR